MNTELEALGFARVHETEKAVLWSCPLGQFWRPKKHGWPSILPAQQSMAPIARLVAEILNREMVAVKILETTPGGAARISFQAKRLLSDNDLSGPATGKSVKKVDLHVPISWLFDAGGRWLVPVSKLQKKLDDRRQMAKYNGGYKWYPAPTICTNTEDVLAWLQLANADALRARDEEKRVRDEHAAQRIQEAAQERKKRYNQEIAHCFNAVLSLAYAKAAANYGKTARGKAAGVNLLTGIAQVTAALRQPDFPAWVVNWRIKEAIRRARPKPERVPDEEIQHCKVYWASWTGARLVRHEHHESGCIARRYGKKWEIELPGGGLLVKMAGPNLRIVPMSRSDSLTTELGSDLALKAV